MGTNAVFLHSIRARVLFRRASCSTPVKSILRCRNRRDNLHEFDAPASAETGFLASSFLSRTGMRPGDRHNTSEFRVGTYFVVIVHYAPLPEAAFDGWLQSFRISFVRLHTVLSARCHRTQPRYGADLGRGRTDKRKRLPKKPQFYK